MQAGAQRSWHMLLDHHGILTACSAAALPRLPAARYALDMHRHMCLQRVSNVFGKTLGKLRSDAVARSQSSRALTASAAAGVQSEGVVGAVCEACVGPGGIQGQWAGMLSRH
jgi:hypothetical protein